MKIIFPAFFILCCLSLAFSETHVSGDIRTAVLDSSGNPYIVDQDWAVPAGKKLTIKEGCVFLFKAFTGLNVVGSLQVSGSRNHPVVFTSVNDAEYNPKSDQQANPFDWNGILVSKEAKGAQFENIALRYAVYGIQSQSLNVSIQNGVFKQNGQFHCKIGDKMQYVQDNIPFSYTATTTAPETSTSNEIATAANKTPEAKKAKASGNTLVVRYTSLGVGIVGIAAGSIMLIPWSNAKKELNLSHDAFVAKYHDDPGGQWTKFDNDIIGFGWGSTISYILGGLGLAGFGVSFAF
ncbi:MAG TPA: hypothetical protein VLX68_02080 [Chitinivibrionales bacterium]|nr:hypothetical protein [Chitinivibrionales bacterium]